MAGPIRAAYAQAQTASTAGAKPTQHVVFMCPHGAAKQRAGLRLFRAAGQGEGVERARRRPRHLQPDPSVSPKVAQHLTDGTATASR